MALYVKPNFDSPRQWAKASLVKGGVRVLKVERVFPPEDTGDTCEVLFLDERERPRTAFIEPSGKVAKNSAGW